MPLLTYNELGAAQKSVGSIREDLMDYLEILSPKDTPLFNNLGSVKVNAGYVEFLEDTLTAAATNAFPEGAAATDPTLATPSRSAAIVQNFQKHWAVSGRAQSVNRAGMASMLAYQEMKAVREIKTDIELALHRGSAVTGTTTTASQMNGMLNLLSTYFTACSGLTLTEKVFNNLVCANYSTPVNLRECYLGIALKRTVNQFTTSVQRFIPAADRKSLDIIDVYESEMGVIALFKSRYQLAGNMSTTWSSLIVIDPDYFQVGWLRPLQTLELGLDGDRTQRFIVGEATLIARSEKAGVGGSGYAQKIT